MFAQVCSQRGELLLLLPLRVVHVCIPNSLSEGLREGRYAYPQKSLHTYFSVAKQPNYIGNVAPSQLPLCGPAASQSSVSCGFTYQVPTGLILVYS